MQFTPRPCHPYTLPTPDIPAFGSRTHALARKKTAAASEKPPGGSLKDLLKELWEAAVNLHGSIEPADYKRYILPVIFLRFLSLRYDRRREELERKIADPNSDYHTTNAKHAEVAFYDAVAANYGTVYEPGFLRDLIHEVVQTLKRNLKVDWTADHPDQVRFGVRAAVKRVLLQRGVKAEDLELMSARIMEQAAATFADWPLLAV